jgi:sec-independent protein translocase protein TatB
MLDVGFSEILLTSAIALIVLGPERLPKVARQVGNWMGRARAMARQLSEQLEREVNAEDLLKTQNRQNPRIGVPPPLAPDVAPPNVAAPSVAPSNVTAPHSPAPGAAEAAHQPADSPPERPPPEPVYGLDASLTTAAAMHAFDPPPVDPHAAAPHPSSTHE